VNRQSLPASARGCIVLSDRSTVGILDSCILPSRRNLLGLRTGDQFIVIGRGDAVILKSISEPSVEEFDGLMEQARIGARRARMKSSDIQAAIAKVRGSKK